MGTMAPREQAAAAVQPNAPTARIRVRGLSKRYGALEVFRDIDFELGEREIITIVGPSGCGKTTLLRCIDGLIPVDGGEIWCGRERVTGPEQRLRRHAGPVRALAADQLLLDHGGGQATRGRPPGHVLTNRATTDDDDVEVHGSHSRRGSRKPHEAEGVPDGI